MKKTADKREKNKKIKEKPRTFKKGYKLPNI
jgi:hypothetical protein